MGRPRNFALCTVAVVIVAGCKLRSERPAEALSKGEARSPKQLEENTLKISAAFSRLMPHFVRHVESTWNEKVIRDRILALDATYVGPLLTDATKVVLEPIVTTLVGNRATTPGCVKAALRAVDLTEPRTGKIGFLAPPEPEMPGERDEGIYKDICRMRSMMGPAGDYPGLHRKLAITGRIVFDKFLDDSFQQSFGTVSELGDVSDLSRFLFQGTKTYANREPARGKLMAILDGIWTIYHAFSYATVKRLGAYPDGRDLVVDLGSERAGKPSFINQLAATMSNGLIADEFLKSDPSAKSKITGPISEMHLALSINKGLLPASPRIDVENGTFKFTGTMSENLKVLRNFCISEASEGRIDERVQCKGCPVARVLDLFGPGAKKTSALQSLVTIYVRTFAIVDSTIR